MKIHSLKKKEQEIWVIWEILRDDQENIIITTAATTIPKKRPQNLQMFPLADSWFTTKTRINHPHPYPSLSIFIIGIQAQSFLTQEAYLRTKPSLCFARSYLSNSQSWNWTSCRVSSPAAYLAPGPGCRGSFHLTVPWFTPQKTRQYQACLMSLI